ncbi:MAG: type II and III secretion system protein family protein [Pseudolabrys sp.]
MLTHQLPAKALANRNSTIRTFVRIAALTVLIAGAGLAPTAPATAADPQHVQVIQVAASEATSRFIPLGVGKSVAIDLPADIKDVLVADPKIANAVIRSSRRVYMIGVTVGQTNIFFFDANGKQIAGFDLAVTRDLNGVRAALKQTMPDSDIRIEGVGADGIMLSGSAASAAESQHAYDIAARLVGDTAKVVNGITVRGRDQVMLKVTVAEVRRDVIKQLGIDLSGSINYGTAVVNFNSQNPFTATGQTLSNSSLGASLKNINATLRAMDRAGVLRTLAEPNLTAISGETASFVAGGEFPIPNGLSCDTTKSPPVCQAQVDFKKFGVSLVFTPVVLSEGRISLKVMTEVSDLSPDNALTIAVPGSTQSLTIPSISTRRAETTVEIPSGGSLALAGMIQEQTKVQVNGVPGIMSLPILGSLFRSRDYINHQTELMVIVTPYVVRAVAQKQLSRPDDGFVDASDPASALLGRLNRIYGSSNPAPVTPAAAAEQSANYRGKYGFILD